MCLLGILGFGPALSVLEACCDVYPSVLVRLRSDNTHCILVDVVEGQQQTFPLVRCLGLVEAHRSPIGGVGFPTQTSAWSAVLLAVDGQHLLEKSETYNTKTISGLYLPADG